MYVAVAYCNISTIKFGVRKTAPTYETLKCFLTLRDTKVSLKLAMDMCVVIITLYFREFLDAMGNDVRFLWS